MTRLEIFILKRLGWREMQSLAKGVEQIAAVTEGLSVNAIFIAADRWLVSPRRRIEGKLINGG